MTADEKKRGWNRIPIKFVDSVTQDDTPGTTRTSSGTGDGDQSLPEESGNEEVRLDNQQTGVEEQSGEPYMEDSEESLMDLPEQAGQAGGPAVAELVATRAELKRVETEVNELKERLARRQADFENYRKRVERERVETYNRAVADIATKLLPVLDNLKRALDTEASVEASESDEFRHFLSGVDLIYKQLNGVLDALGVKPLPAMGEAFNPHVHEAVITEPTDEYEPDTIIQEIVRGYRLGDKLIRPALVKVAVRK